MSPQANAGNPPGPNQFARSASDTGSPEVQIGLFTKRITELTAHLKVHPKDNHSRRGLLMMVSKRRTLLDYLKRKNAAKYNEVIKELDLRR